MRSLLFFCALGAALTSQGAQAQGNDLYGPAGGRSALMGNTGVALGRDGSAPFHNPATIVRIFDEKLAFSANFYSFAVTTFEDWHAPAALDAERFGQSRLEGPGLTVTSFRSLPSSLCLFLTLEDLARLGELAREGPEQKALPLERGTRKKLAFCFASIESEDNDLQAIHFEGRTEGGATTQVQSLQRRWNRVFVGPTYSFGVNEDLAFGGSLQVVYSYTSFGVAGTSLSMSRGGTGIASSLSTSGSGRSFDLIAVLGATYRFQRFTLGVSVRAPALHLLGSYEGTSSRSTHASDLAESFVASGEGSFRAPPPIRFAVGGGLTLDRLRLELDAALVVPTHSLLRAEVDVTETRLTDGQVSSERTRERFGVRSTIALNPAFGAEYFFSSDFSLMTGVSANFSALSELHPSNSVGNLVQSRLHHLTGAVGLGSYWEGGELLFGFSFDYGWGDAIAINPYRVPNDWSVIDAHSYSITFVISGSASLRSIANVVGKIAE